MFPHNLSLLFTWHHSIWVVFVLPLTKNCIMEKKLCLLETKVYICGWILANINFLSNLLQAQTDIFKNNPSLENSLRDLRPGWSFLSRAKDVSDVEWTSWKYFLHTSWCYLIFQFFVSEMIRRNFASYLKFWYILSSLLFVSFYMGMRQMIIIFIQPIIFVTIILCGGKKTTVWVSSILVLGSYNSLKYKSFFWNFLDYRIAQDEEVYLILFSIAWIQLRCISFCIDYIEKKERLITSKSKVHEKPAIFQIIIDMFSYVLYLPLLYVGPIILYEDFEKSFYVKNEKILLRLKRFVWDMFLFSVYTFIMDLALHYFYFFAMQNNVMAISKMSTLALCGGGLWMGLQFHMKYVISYGTTSAFARLDNMEPPPTPRCIARIHVYSQMWRYFDVGLYKFLVKYIYKPGFETLTRYVQLSKITYKLIASLATFIFIFTWHGTMLNIFIWSVLNYIGILLEQSAQAFSKTDRYKHFKQKFLKTDQMEIRLTALLCSPLLAVSAISNFYLFAGSEIANIYFGLFYCPTFYNFIIVLISLYSCCQVSIALKDFPSRTDVKRLDTMATK